MKQKTTFKYKKCHICPYDLGKIKATPHNLHLQTKPPSKMLSG